MTQAPDPDLAELSRLDREIPVLFARAQQARADWAAAEEILMASRRRRDEVDSRLRTRAASAATSQAPVPQGPVPQGPVPQGPVQHGPAAVAQATRTPEASTRTFQNALFILGGLLLCTAAIVFTAVAWASYGVGGRAAILGIATALTLSAPLVALSRRLRATAETFAGVGLLLVALDGYAAWYVNLFGVNALPGTGYAGLVCAVTAAAAAGYGLLTRLIGPGFVAVLVVQPAVPLFATQWHLGAAGWSILSCGLVALNLAIVRRTTRGASGVVVAHQAISWVIAACWWLLAGLIALGALLVADTVGDAAWAGVATLLVAGTLGLAAAISRLRALSAVAGAAMVLATMVAAMRFVAVAWPDFILVLVAAVVAVVALLVRAARPMMPASARPGAVVALAVTGGLVGTVLAGFTVLAAVGTIEHAFPFWQATLVSGGRYDWQLLAGLGLTAAAFVAIAPALVRPPSLPAARTDALVVAGSLAALALPATVALPWWAPSVVDTAMAASLIAMAVIAGSSRRANVAALAAAALAGHAVLASLTRPANTATILGALVVIGVATAAWSRRRAPQNDVGARQWWVAGSALAVGLSALAPAVGSALVAGHVPAWWVARLTCASVLLVLAALFLTHRRFTELRWYAFAAVLVSAMVWPTVAGLTGTDPIGIYAGSALVLMAVALVPMRETPALTWAAAAAVPPAALFAVAVLPAVATVVLSPYAWFGAIWSGAPSDVGLAPAGADSGPVGAAHAVALGLLAVASAVAVYAVRRRVLAALAGLGVGGPTAIIVALVAAGANWPTVPAVTLLLGLVILVAVAVVQLGQWRTAIGAVQAAAYIGAGLAGALTVTWSTLVGLGSIVVAAVVVGVAGRTVAWRVGGWLAAVGAALATATASGLAADLLIRDTGYAVLGVAVLALAVGTALRPRATAHEAAGAETRTAKATAATDGAAWPGPARLTWRGERESTAVQAAAHAGAVVALLFTVGSESSDVTGRGTSIGHTAAISSIWGVAVGLRALWPDTSREGRAQLAAVAGGWQLLAWWLLLASREVTLVEAYTLPLAAVALLAGWAALRARPELRSWIAYGPALAAAFLPSLAIVLAPGLYEEDLAGSDHSIWRRLLLGVGALAVVFAGSVRRRQAPVVIGGIVVVMVALHEIALVWDLLPRWIPLAVGGLLLVGLAITYERRRRDVAWLRATLGRMH